ncbi:D-alanyl-D-alanine carboxypeptidase family protein [Brucella intermedia]|uniref:serine-type D-Ala-D-Ala carboxypeptidase n=1 Tax=Brucella intermedia TaxID=94625 RepID=A0A7V6TXZ4_9HYPH|nr:D-alanyl-D-alanine carboxypeptidase family protein [Brucella intermedia]PJR94577.1 D-alanyl-D-alanine carboxypeptidase [Ochrobactrum sp. 721/2009]PJT17862.1 D-alanyl-D-alanine carboxypeptidase [Ochrobactrum sp. 720/2009]PJT21005.1 D-alanyl-D-alanine carboxypeptidase [Ochrobactrum sp. 715/2009]PJT31197.1 D-alanyl-D-alanine carboxypeptidase [Ochrobactrum sp. 695/2009]PJT33223.1 D-alanyl-D-alanine carboxypeptidase [Ochrobactrum sp. 689/2009]
MGLLSKTLIFVRAAAAGISVAVFVPAICWAAPADAAFVTKAPQVLLVDDRSGTVLLSKNANVPIPPASLAKLMTAEVVFEALEKGLTTLDTAYPVSENAWRTGGAPSGTSTMFARIKSSPTVADLLQGMIVQSANDGAIVLAEGLAGSERAFAERMNDRARELGLAASRFVNSTGLPAEGQTVSLQDLVRLAQHIRTAHPKYYKYYAQPAFTWNNIMQRNRNPLLRLDVGADGMGTGFTEASGFALVGSAEQNGRRLYLAMSGLSSIKEREEEAKRLLQWGMTAFDDVLLYPANEIVGEAQVFGGTLAHVPLKVKDRVELLLPKNGRDRLKARIVYKGPLDAPVADDQQVGVLQLELNGSILRDVPVFTAQSVDEGSLSKRALGAAMELSTGWLRKYL